MNLKEGGGLIEIHNIYTCRGLIRIRNTGSPRFYTIPIPHEFNNKLHCTPPGPEADSVPVAESSPANLVWFTERTGTVLYYLV